MPVSIAPVRGAVAADEHARLDVSLQPAAERRADDVAERDRSSPPDWRSAVKSRFTNGSSVMYHARFLRCGT
jgi:hypothetical protein